MRKEDLEFLNRQCQSSPALCSLMTLSVCWDVQVLMQVLQSCYLDDVWYVVGTCLGPH